MSVIGFDERIIFRLKSEEKSKIMKVMSKNRDIYFNSSHFVRVAVIKLLRDYDKRGKRK